MRKSHFALLAVAIATFGYLAAAPGLATAQEESARAPMPPDPDLTAEQQAELDSWPSEQQVAYQAWPAETKGYYWTLTPLRQKMFWALSDSDKIALTAMTGTEREAAWDQIESRAGSPPDQG